MLGKFLSMKQLAGPRAEERAPALLEALCLPVTDSRVGGRYVSSLSKLPGTSYWATSTPRFRQDLFGVQFEGPGLGQLGRLRHRLVRAGFTDRGTVGGRRTFARPVPFGANAKVDLEGLRTVFLEAEAILGDSAEAVPERPSFLEFMQASPWADVELELPERIAEPERPLDL